MRLARLLSSALNFIYWVAAGVGLVIFIGLCVMFPILGIPVLFCILAGIGIAIYDIRKDRRNQKLNQTVEGPEEPL